jgi:hypothetical protein
LENDGISPHNENGLGIKAGLKFIVAELTDGKEGTVGEHWKKCGSGKQRAGVMVDQVRQCGWK